MAGKDGTGQAGMTAAELWPPLWKPSARGEEVNQGPHQEDKQTPMCCHHSNGSGPLEGAEDTAADRPGNTKPVRSCCQWWLHPGRI